MQEEIERGFVWRGDGAVLSAGHPPRLRGAQCRRGDRNRVFPTQYLRFFRLIAIPDGFTLYGDPIVTRSAFAEMEIYGRGFAPQATL